MINLIISSIFRITFFLLLILIQFLYYRKWKESKNRMMLLTIILFLFIQISSIISVLLNAFPVFNLIIGEALTLDLFLLLIIATLQIILVIYLKKYEKYYTLTLVIFAYIILGLFLSDNLHYVSFYIIFAAVFTFGFLFKIGFSHRNGLVLSIGVFTLIYNISNFVLLKSPQIIIQTIAVIPLILGAIGVVDKYILFDKEKEEKIRSSWIAKKVKL